jgi:hypothetical protein
MSIKGLRKKDIYLRTEIQGKIKDKNPDATVPADENISNIQFSWKLIQDMMDIM